MKFPLHPNHPERICWGCEKLCPVNDMRCGNGTDRAQHPVELFGEDWYELELARETEAQSEADRVASTQALCPLSNHIDIQ